MRNPKIAMVRYTAKSLYYDIAILSGDALLRRHKTTSGPECPVYLYLYHVTLSRGIQNNHSYEIFDPYLPIHDATFMRLR